MPKHLLQLGPLKERLTPLLLISAFTPNATKLAALQLKHPLRLWKCRREGQCECKVLASEVQEGRHTCTHLIHNPWLHTLVTNDAAHVAVLTH